MQKLLLEREGAFLVSNMIKNNKNISKNVLTKKSVFDIIAKSMRPVGQAAKTPPSHGGNGGSIPPRVTKQKSTSKEVLFCLVSRIRRGNRKPGRIA